MFFYVKHGLDIFLLYKKFIFLPFLEFEFFCWLWHLPSGGWGRTKGMYSCFEVSCYLAADPVLKALGNIRTTMTHNLHLNIHWTSLCLKFSLRWWFIKKSHRFVMMYSYNCNGKSLSFFVISVWLKGVTQQHNFKAIPNWLLRYGIIARVWM